MITLLYFARLRESLGQSRETLELPSGVSDVAGLLAFLRTRGADWETALAPGRALRIAVNQTMASERTAVHDGDEVALFPPVTGG
jgi:sulfur-carrier protein